MSDKLDSKLEMAATIEIKKKCTANKSITSKCIPEASLNKTVKKTTKGDEVQVKCITNANKMIDKKRVKQLHLMAIY